jgi:hypothetical protein
LPIRIAIYVGATVLALGCLWVINPLHPTGRSGLEVTNKVK